MQVTGSSKHFPVFDAERPVPGGFDDTGGVGVFEEDGSVVFYLGINIGFDMVGDSCDGDGCLPMHQPGHKVGAVTAEVTRGAAAIFYRIGQPVEEVLAAAYFFGSLVAIVYDHFAWSTDGIVVYQFVDLLIGIIPGSFVVGEHLDMVLLSQGRDAVCVLNGGSQGFFDHDGNAFWCTDLDYAKVFGDGVVSQYGIGVGVLNEFGQAIVKK